MENGEWIVDCGEWIRTLIIKYYLNKINFYLYEIRE